MKTRSPLPRSYGAATYPVILACCVLALPALLQACGNNSPTPLTATTATTACAPPTTSAATTAICVYGQGGSFTANRDNNGGVSALSLSNPSALALDAQGGLYVADQYNNRVLHYPKGSITADQVYGQSGSFTTSAGNPSYTVASATSLEQPSGLALDAQGGLYVADTNNNRVLHYSAGAATADRVYGQGGSFTDGSGNHGGTVSASTLLHPFGLALDAQGGLYAADGGNYRVLHYPKGSTTADRVYGQPDFTTANPLASVSASSLNFPGDVALDAQGGLYVADTANNRVLHYPKGSTTADRVYGQSGSFTTATANAQGVSASSLNGPGDVALDAQGGLYVADGGNNRVLSFPAP